ncbi:MAG: glycoside hydrolase family 18 protein, partial [Methanosarcinales archaeon]
MKAYIECKFSHSGTEMETAEILNIGHRKHANEAIIDFIDRSLKISFKDNIENNITGAAVIGEVGAGKSQFLKGFTRKINKGLIKGKNLKAIALYVSSDDYLELCKENANITQIFISAYNRILEKRTEDDFLSKEKYANGLSDNEIELLKQRLDDKANKFINSLVEFFKDLGYDRVFLMVDELENLVKVEDINHSAFIADLKSFLTGYKIRNYVSIVIACSRAAWKEFATITELFDPAERRLVEIVLKRFSMEEAFQFVEKSIIGDIPFTTGAVRTLWNASRGLPGDLSSLCYFAIEKASKDLEIGYSNPIDYAIVLDTIKNYPLRIGEEEINAINDSALQLIENSLKNQGENYLKVFQKLIGEIKEYTIEELSADLDIDEESLRKIIGYLHGGRILGFNAKLVTILYKIKDINQANNALLEYGLIDEDSLRNTNLKVDKLFKELSAFSLGSKSHYLPIDPEDLARRLGIKPDFAKDIINSLRDYPEVLGKEIFYRISEIAKYRLFPPPAEESLSFIKTFKERQMILDKFTSSFGTEEGDSIFLKGFLEFGSRIGIKIISEDLIELKHWGVSLPTKVFAVSGREVKSEVLGVRSQVLGDSATTPLKPNIYDLKPNLLLCLHNGPITPSAEQILKQRDQAIGTTLRDRFLAIKIDEELSKTLVSLSLLRNRELPISSIKEEILSERIEEMKKALDINNILMDWYDKAKNSGIILQTWPLDVFGGKTTDFHKMYEMILCSYNELPIKRIEKIYNKAREVEPDLEPKTLLAFNTRFESLLKFGIIKRTDKGYKLVVTPVEKLVMQLISNKRTFEIKDISKYFINFDTALSLNAKLAHYLKLLELKGILKREKNLYEVVKLDEAIQDCKRNYEKAKELYDNSNKDQGYGGQYIAYDYDIKKIMEKIEYYYKLFQQSQYIHIPSLSEDLEQSPKVLIPIRKISELLNNKKGLIEHYNNAKDTFLKAVHLIENAE